jgi:hypothetical protein
LSARLVVSLDVELDVFQVAVAVKVHDYDKDHDAPAWRCLVSD